MFLLVLLPFYSVGFFVYNVEFLFVIHIFSFFLGLYVFGSSFITDFFHNRVVIIKSNLSEFFINYYFGLLYVRVFVSYFRIFLFVSLIYFFSYFFSIFSFYSISAEFLTISSEEVLLSSVSDSDSTLLVTILNPISFETYVFLS
jgi:hypothetical protein